jgi:hypothetical protein
MSYKTLEVELENGRVHPAGGESLPTNAHALLTILTAQTPTQPVPTNGSLAERVADLAGIGRGQHTDLSSNRAHLDDFGR